MAWASIALLCSLSFSTFAVAEDSVDLPLRWKTGDKLRYEIVKTRKRSRDDRIALDVTTRTDLDVEVLRADKDGYLIAWTQGETRFDDPRQAANPMVRQMTNLVKGLQTVLEVDSGAVIVGVQNWKELKATVAKTLVTVTEELKNAGLDAEMIGKVKAQVASMFATREQIEAMCTREAQMFFLVLGGSYSASEPTEYEDRLPNPFGGEPFPSRAAFALKQVDRESQRAVITWTQTLDPDATRRIIEKSLKDLAARVGGPAPQGEPIKSLAIDDAAESAVDLETGWLDRLTHKRTVKTEGGMQEDTLTITRKPEQTESEN